MNTLQELYGEYFTQLSGKVYYMVLVKSMQGQLTVINTCHPNCPKYELDWLALNYFNNVSDIIIQTSKNTSIDSNLHVYPDKQILQKYNIDLIEKQRICVITTNSAQSLNFQSTIFQDPVQIILYSKSQFTHDLPVIVYDEFEFEGLRKACQAYGNTNSICLECGATLFNILLGKGQVPDFLFVTVLEGDEEREYLAGALDMQKIEENYRIVFESQSVKNADGEWKMRVYQKTFASN